ncbi:hypothetical protein DKK68_00645 [Bifidobacterium asteroides]|uniref:hypothetical protein n=1 Tax=Bifidobacterium asteroides TaxID=1684 RepID=UPI000D786FAD|nr:hypothetical protein [Bifidobacterium asteroides]PXY88719.1 hypothetical protein DKK68_00645 [Bifidobacterium asteroides]
MMGIRKKFKELKNQKLTLFRPDDTQWLTLGQLQQRYDDLKDQRDKQMDHAQRLLALCAVSSFISFMSQPAWKKLKSTPPKVMLVFCTILLVTIVFLIALVIMDDLYSPIKTPMLVNTTAQAQPQSTGKNRKNLLDEWKTQVDILESHNNLREAIIISAYAAYAVALEGIIACFLPL